MNPSSVAYSSDGMLNTLALNSLYNVFYAVYSMKNEIRVGRLRQHGRSRDA